jgi:PAS domain-containing protein
MVECRRQRLVTGYLILLLLATAGVSLWLAFRDNRLRAALVELQNDERERLFDLSLDMMCVARFDGSVKLANPQFNTTLGWSNEEVLTDNFVNFVHPDDRELTAKGMMR